MAATEAVVLGAGTCGREGWILRLTPPLCLLAFLLPLLPEASRLPYALCVGVLPVVGMLARADKSVRERPYAPALLYVGLCALTLAASPYRASGVSSLALLLAFACGMAVAHAATAKQHVAGVLRASLLAGVVASVHAIAQYYGGASSSLMLDFEGRVTGAFENPNHLGGYLACLLPVAAVSSAAEERQGWRWSWTGAGTLMYVALLFTASRGAWWAFIISACCVGIFAVRLAPSVPWRMARRSLAVLLCSWAVATALYSLPTPVVVKERAQLAERFTTIPELYAIEVHGASSLGHRRLIWSVAWDMIAERPLIGFGYGTFAAVYPAYRDRHLAKSSHYNTLGAAMLADNAGFAHNEYLQVAAESGVAGLLCFLAGIAYIVWTALAVSPPPE